MKVVAPLLFVSLLVNAVLIALSVTRPAPVSGRREDQFKSELGRAATGNTVIARDRGRDPAAGQQDTARKATEEARLWSRLDSSDLPTLISRLRAAGFPASVIRGMVNARLDARFHSRIAKFTEESRSMPFWKAEPQWAGDFARLLELQAEIRRETIQMRRQLFGDTFFTQDATAASAERRGLYGDLPSAKVNLIEQINRDYAEMEQQVRNAARGILLPEDREKLALLQSERRRDLAAVLTPAELEDHLMRTSPITVRLRSALSLMDATEAEFRALYKIYLPHADVLFPAQGGSGLTTMEMALKRRELQDTLWAEACTALGETRAKEFFRAGTAEYRQLTQLALRNNLPADAAARVFDVRDLAASESKRIYENRSLGVDEKRAALKALAQTTSNQVLVALGSNAGQQYLRSVPWLPAIANGAMVSFTPEGGWSSRSVSRPAAPKAKGGP